MGTVVGFAAFATSRAAWYLALDGRAATAGTTEGFTALVLFATLRSGLAIWPQVVQIYVHVAPAPGASTRPSRAAQSAPCANTR